jgi:hypothetical protein
MDSKNNYSKQSCLCFENAIQNRTGNGNACRLARFYYAVEYTSSTTGHNQTFATIYQQLVRESKAIVQLRWVYYNISEGSRSQIALDDVLITTTNLATTNLTILNL